MVPCQPLLLEAAGAAHDLLETRVSVGRFDRPGSHCRLFACRRFWLQLQPYFRVLAFLCLRVRLRFSHSCSPAPRLGRKAAAILSAALLVYIAYGGLNIPQGWLLGSKTYVELGHQEWHAGIYRLGVYLLEIISAALFLAWVPNLTSKLTDLGRRTLYVFLLHGFLVRVAIWSGVYSYMGNALFIPIILGVAILFSVTLAHPLVRQTFKVLIEPDISRISFHRHGAFKRSA